MGLVASGAALLAPPLLVWGGGCLLGGRFPGPAHLAWIGHVLVVADGAAVLTVALARRARRAIENDRPAQLLTVVLLAVALLVAPLALIFWPEAGTFRAAALSPLFGFLSL